MKMKYSNKTKTISADRIIIRDNKSEGRLIIAPLTTYILESTFLTTNLSTAKSQSNCARS